MSDLEAMVRLFHHTRSAEAILREGFRDGRYRFTEGELSGVWLMDRVDLEEGRLPPGGHASFCVVPAMRPRRLGSQEEEPDVHRRVQARHRPLPDAEVRSRWRAGRAM